MESVTQGDRTKHG